MPFLLDRARLARWALVYALFVIYGSVVVGPIGFHFVPADPVTVWHKFLAVRYVPHRSDQRPDWMANLLMLVPFGFMVAGAMSPLRGRWRRRVAAAAAFLLCFAFVLAVKYAQLFFPGRTVTINYIAAQGIGAFLGVTALALGRERLVARVLRPLAGGGRAGLMAALGVYAALLLYFLLLPFDVALSRSDLHERLAELPHLLWALPGAGRGTAVRAALVLAATAAMAPVGMLLALAWPRRSLRWIGLIGLVAMLGVTALTLPILSATPMLAAIVYRSAGVLAGAALLRGVRPAGLERARWLLARAVPWLWLPYLVLLALFNGLLTPHWRTPAQALAALDWNGLIPLWHDYIVPKTEAAKSTVVHLVMYAPIGVMVWLRAGSGRRQRIGAGMLAGLCSLAVELGRWMKPGLQPDFNEVVIGGLAAGLTVLWAPRAWALLLDAVAEISGAPLPDGGDRGDSFFFPSSSASPFPSWPGLTRPSAHERSGADNRVKPGHAGVDSPLTASMCQSWSSITPTNGSHP